jgi:hypothetical protein
MRHRDRAIGIETTVWRERQRDKEIESEIDR